MAELLVLLDLEDEEVGLLEERLAVWLLLAVAHEAL